jgi:hypothetical protein
MTNRRFQQYEVDSMLRFGIVCSLVWMMGLGSLWAVVCGLRARSIIQASNGEVTGMGKVRWCLVVGCIGLVIWLPLIVVILWRRDIYGG